jgi:hypothetical protein
MKKIVIFLSTVVALVAVACDPKVSVSSNSGGMSGASGMAGVSGMPASSSSANASGMGGESSTENAGAAGQSLTPAVSASASN